MFATLPVLVFSYIQGCLSVRSFPAITIDVHGVGYELTVSFHCYEQLPLTGKNVRLYTHFHVREDVHILYGFLQEDERRLFRHLIRVSGLGAKLAMGVLSSVPAGELVSLLAGKEKDALTKLPGIGRKTADRMIIELHDKLDDFATSDGVRTSSTNRNLADAEEALIKLGYKSHEVRKALARTEKKDDISIMIRKSLRILAQREQ